jgi:hypothetical protein
MIKIHKMILGKVQIIVILKIIRIQIQHKMDSTKILKKKSSDHKVSL